MSKTIVLLGSIGKRGLSSFVFAAVYKEDFSISIDYPYDQLYYICGFVRSLGYIY